MPPGHLIAAGREAVCHPGCRDLLAAAYRPDAARKRRTAWQIASTPALRLVAPALLRALPVIVELACLVNSLLWGPELLTRAWRT